MRLHEFTPVYDVAIEGESFIDLAFGPEFYVVDETGQFLTTAHNQNLLRRAASMLARRSLAEVEAAAEALRQLSRQAERITQGDYERAVRREFADHDAWQCADHSLHMGSIA